MLSLTSQHALRAIVYLAQESDDQLVAGNRIAAKTGVPSKYLSKILGDLTRANVLHSVRGKLGGFRFARPTSRISLFEVIAPFERPEQRRCPFQNKKCRDSNPCVAHESWKKVRDAEERFLKTTTVREVALGKEKKKKRKR